MIIIDGNNMTTRPNAHAELKSKLSLPDHYGANLDALWDCLGDISAEVRFENPGPMLESLGSYGLKLLKTLIEASAKYPGFTLETEETPGGKLSF